MNLNQKQRIKENSQRMLGVVLLIISPAISIIQSGNAAPVALVERVERLNFISQSVYAV